MPSREGAGMDFCTRRKVQKQLALTLREGESEKATDGLASHITYNF
jgi:hypothetical protein